MTGDALRLNTLTAATGGGRTSARDPKGKTFTFNHQLTGFKSSTDIPASKPYFTRWQLSAKLALALIDTTQAHGWYEQARLDKDFIRILLQLQGFFSV